MQSTVCNVRIIDPVRIVQEFAYRHPETILVIGQVVERLPCYVTQSSCINGSE